MLIGILVGVLGLGITTVAYDSRDELAGRPRGRELALYLLAVAVSIGLAVAVIELTTANQGICGPPGGSHRGCA